MAGILLPNFKATLLNALVGKALPYTAPRLTYLGLAHGIPSTGTPTLTTINEVTTAGYARINIDWNDAVVSSNGLVRITNIGQKTIGPVTADMPLAYYAFLTSASSGTSGELLYIWELAEPLSALAGKPILIPDNGLVIE